MTIPDKIPDAPRIAEIEEYIATVDETLEKVFSAPPKRRTELVASLKRESRQYWETTLHYLPLYSAADLIGIQVSYPDFDQYEQLYAKLIEGKKTTRSAESVAGDD